MTSFAWLQLGGYLALLIGLGLPLGHYMARVYTGEARLTQRVLGPVERVCYRLLGIDPGREMGWREYTLAVLAISVVSLVAVYAIQRLQGVLPVNPAGLPGVPAFLAFNTAVSFATNTNWQAYGGETTLSNLTQMLALTVQNFVSAAVGMAVLAALIRGFTRRTASTIGNAWVDITRSVLYILLPLAVVLSLLLVSQGVVQTMAASREVTLVQPFQADSAVVTTQTIAVGPAASQVAIKQLGTNGGGFFNVNSAHPLENPTPFSNLLEVLAILLIPAGLCFTFGRMVKDDRQGWAILAAMTIIFAALTIPTMSAEQAGNPALTSAGADQVGDRHPAGRQHGGQGGALRAGRLEPLGHRDHLRLERLGQLDARLVHAAGRPLAALADAAGRGRVRRGRLRALRHADLRDPGGVHRRTDGGPHAGVPGQEDRGPRGDALGADRAADRARCC